MADDCADVAEQLVERIARVCDGDGDSRSLRTDIASVLREHADAGLMGDANAHRALRRSRERMKKLNEVAMQLEKVRCEEAVYHLGIEAAESVLDLTASTIDVVEGDMLIPSAESSRLPEGGAHPISVYEGLIGKTYRTGRSFRVGNIHKCPEARPAHPDYRSLVSVPIGDLGVFQCVSTEEDAFDAEVAEMLEILALHLAAAVRRIRTQRREEKNRRAAERLASEYAMIFSGTQDGMFLVEMADDGPFILQRGNSALERMTGHPVTPRGDVGDLFGQTLRGEFVGYLKECLRCREPISFAMEPGPEQDPRYFTVQLSPIAAAGGEVTQIIGSVCDRTAEKRAERALQESEEKYRTLVQSSNDAILIVQNRCCVFANPAAGRLMACAPEELVGGDWRTMVHPGERRRVHRMALARGRGENVPDMYESALLDRSGAEVEVELNVNTTTFRGDEAFLISLRDISRRKAVEQQLRYLSFHDQLTDLYNRAYFENELERLDVPRQLPFSIVLADVNGLKLINDVFGHREGDRLLREVGGILRGAAREEDVVARIGGDEFAILVPHTDADDAESIVSRVEARCRQREEFTITVSMGAATKADVHTDVWEVFSRAEERMYRDKMLRRHSARNAIIKSLRSALEVKTMETSEHMQRLEHLGVAVGRHLGLGESRLKNMALLAQLHDIGKVAVPVSVLRKVEPLSPTERAEIERHPEIGYRIAQTTVDLASISDDILSHHEWYNGEGYPRGLRGEAIPLLARILAVVDAYDAMTSERPYCRARSREEALAELRAQAGKQFDPDVVEAFLAVVQEPEEG